MPEAVLPGPATRDESASGTPRIVLAFDFGHRRIGVACGDTVSRTAAPLNAVPAGAAGPRWEVIETLVREWQPALAVVGLPYNVDGSDSAMTRAAREFAPLPAAGRPGRRALFVAGSRSEAQVGARVWPAPAASRKSRCRCSGGLRHLGTLVY